MVRGGVCTRVVICQVNPKTSDFHVRARIQSPGKKARLIHSSQAEFFFFWEKNNVIATKEFCSV